MDDICSGEMHGLVKCVNSIHNIYLSSSYLFVGNKPKITIFSSTYSKNLVFDGSTCTGATFFGPDGQELDLHSARKSSLPLACTNSRGLQRGLKWTFRKWALGTRWLLPTYRRAIHEVKAGMVIWVHSD
ncbi:hypothetical protein BKA65DRAFT_121174 [Rhexocercosporidium sp. MPI-PUGE-AT-0058]|nr:hypothetical protein BKA65DRAFT_121174 [Rhexocercosporidium sp. MPI-PUGE-AT-0058]